HTYTLSLHDALPIFCLKLLQIAEHGATSPRVLQEYACHAARQFARYLPQVHHLSRSSRELDFEVVAEVVVKLLQRLDEQVVRRRSEEHTSELQSPCN